MKKIAIAMLSTAWIGAPALAASNNNPQQPQGAQTQPQNNNQAQQNAPGQNQADNQQSAQNNVSPPKMPRSEIR